MTARVPEGGEFAIIGRLQRRLPGPPAGEVWIGDDSAVLVVGPGAGPGQRLLTTDMSIEAVHADLALMGLDDLGWRAVAAAVSDIAAMGGRATHLVVAVAGPPSTDLDTLFGGMAEAAAAHGCPVVGGDLSNAAEVVVVVTVAGVVDDGPAAVLRGGARSGDHLFLTGSVGASAAGLRILRAGAATGGGPGATAPPTVLTDTQLIEAQLIDAHRRPHARLAEGETARRAGATAMIDISDGLAADLGHLADASGVGIELHRVPVAPGATVEEALGGGEDYELVFAAPEVDRVTSAFAAAGLRAPIAIGVCTSQPDQRQWGETALPLIGWEHRWT